MLTNKNNQIIIQELTLQKIFTEEEANGMSRNQLVAFINSTVVALNTEMDKANAEIVRLEGEVEKANTEIARLEGDPDEAIKYYKKVIEDSELEINEEIEKEPEVEVNTGYIIDTIEIKDIDGKKVNYEFIYNTEKYNEVAIAPNAGIPALRSTEYCWSLFSAVLSPTPIAPTAARIERISVGDTAPSESLVPAFT